MVMWLLTLYQGLTCGVMNSYIFSKYHLCVRNWRNNFGWRYLESSRDYIIWRLWEIISKEVCGWMPLGFSLPVVFSVPLHWGLPQTPRDIFSYNWNLCKIVSAKSHSPNRRALYGSLNLLLQPLSKLAAFLSLVYESNGISRYQINCLFGEFISPSLRHRCFTCHSLFIWLINMMSFLKWNEAKCGISRSSGSLQTLLWQRRTT